MDTHVRITLLKSKHIIVAAYVNGIRGRFMVDTGASATCIDSARVEIFKVKLLQSQVTTHGATGKMETFDSANNTIRTGKGVFRGRRVVCFELSHVNDAPAQMREKPIDGIIGADILIKANAVIDYAQKKMTMET